jgi:hypothetical protein
LKKQPKLGLLCQTMSPALTNFYVDLELKKSACNDATDQSLGKLEGGENVEGLRGKNEDTSGDERMIGGEMAGGMREGRERGMAEGISGGMGGELEDGKKRKRLNEVSVGGEFERRKPGMTGIMAGEMAGGIMTGISEGMAGGIGGEMTG